MVRSEKHLPNGISMKTPLGRWKSFSHVQKLKREIPFVSEELLLQP